jgi:hypothetical protein
MALEGDERQVEDRHFERQPGGSNGLGRCNTKGMGSRDFRLNRFRIPPWASGLVSFPSSQRHVSHLLNMADHSSLVASYYDANTSLEHSRLISNKLEYAITLETILSSLPKTPKSLNIADIGGGTGRYGTSHTLYPVLHTF